MAYADSEGLDQVGHPCSLRSQNWCVLCNILSFSKVSSVYMVSGADLGPFVQIDYVWV